MKWIIILALLLASASYVFSEEQLSVSFSKNSSGELIMTVKGHTAPIIVQAGENKITLHVTENVVNLTALGINDLTHVSVETASVQEITEEKVEEVDTAAGTSSADTQAAATPIPPISPFISPNPPLSTPF